MPMTDLKDLEGYISSLSAAEGEDVALYHFLRTTTHASRVREFHAVLLEHTPSVKRNGIPLQSHDSDKLTIPSQFLPYCLINWKYRCAMLKKAWDIPERFKDLCHEATVAHVQLGKHHPEFWDPNQEDLISRDNRDGVSRVIDGTDMPLEYVEEMAADICAVAYERRNSPMSWVKKNLWSRWELSPEGMFTLIHSVNVIVDNADVPFVED